MGRGNDDKHYRPGVGVILLNRRGEVFVAQRLDFVSDAWQMPQGGIDKGETPEAAARRELKEETGTDNAELVAESRGWYRYELPPDLAATLWKGRYRGQRQKWFVFRFLGDDSEIDLASEHPEFSAWQWVSPERVVELIVPFKRALYRAVMQEFEAVLGAGSARGAPRKPTR
jgi:putative (di)nucleoside polyphosphate hydrolase